MILPVILAGGIGSRLWPLSRKESPKQFLPLLTRNSMLQDALSRLTYLGGDMLPPLIVGNKEHDSLILSQVQSCSIPINKIMLESSSRGTAPAVALAAKWAQKTYSSETILLVLPADHFIDDNKKFCQTMLAVKTIAAQGYLVAFGVKPQYEEVGYGYISYSHKVSEKLYKISSFKEKPSISEARHYISSGNCFWNSGIYMFSASGYLSELKRLQPVMYRACDVISLLSRQNKNFICFDDDLSSQIPQDSIDYAVMEKTNKSIVAELPVEWNDVGSWAALWSIRKKYEADSEGNIIRGNVLVDEAKNTFLESQDRLVVAVGVEDLTVVETKDAVLITHHNKSQKIKNLMARLNNTQYVTNAQSRIHRPWGWYEVLIIEDYFLVKKLHISPKASISLQLHKHRSEHWVVVRGVATVTLNDDIFNLTANQHVCVPVGVKHRIENETDAILEIIEVQTGVYLDESDIVRFEDQYGRVVFSEELKVLT